jgi:hypothetical protein
MVKAKQSRPRSDEQEAREFVDEWLEFVENLHGGHLAVISLNKIIDEINLVPTRKRRVTLLNLIPGLGNAHFDLGCRRGMRSHRSAKDVHRAAAAKARQADSAFRTEQWRQKQAREWIIDEIAPKGPLKNCFSEASRIEDRVNERLVAQGFKPTTRPTIGAHLKKRGLV